MDKVCNSSLRFNRNIVRDTLHYINDRMIAASGNTSTVERKSGATLAFPVVILTLNSEEDTDVVGDSIKELLNGCKVKRATFKNVGVALDDQVINVVVYDVTSVDEKKLRTLGDFTDTYPTVPLVLLAESPADSLLLWALRSRVWDVLKKPLRTDDIERTIGRYLHAHGSYSIAIRVSTTLVNSAHVLTNAVAKNSAVRVCRTRLAIDYIRNHYNERIVLRDVAALCGMSTSVFSRREFRRTHGVNFSAYILQLRIDAAKQLLGNPSTSVTAVAFAVGFSDHSYFSKVFKRFTGLCPSEYRSTLY